MPELIRTLKAKFWSACATPGWFWYRLPALTRKVTEEAASPLSAAATFTPAASTTVAKFLTVRVARAADVLAANISEE